MSRTRCPTTPRSCAGPDGSRSRETDERATQLANVLASRGIGAGDHVALYLYNGVEYLEGMLAAFKLGAVPINVNYRYVEEELRYLLDDADARAVIFHREFTPKLAALRDALPGLGTFIVVDDGADADAERAVGAVEYEAALSVALGDRDFAERSPDDARTSSTRAGPPECRKASCGATKTCSSVRWAARAAARQPITTPEEIAERCVVPRTRCVPACPFMHGTAHWMAFSALFSGGSVIIPTQRHLDAFALWELIGAEQANFVVLVGDAFARPLVEVLDTPEAASLDLSSLRVLLSGGAILSPSVKQALVNRLPGVLVVDGYGASETGGQGQSVSVAGGEIASAPRFSVNDQTAVLGDDLHPVANGVVGRLARRGHIPIGYYKDPEKTAATFPVVDGVRWSVPGDHAVVDDDGMITLLGRGSVSINTGGEKVYPEEVEAVLKAHDAVFDAVVVGVPDERFGERVVAVVQARPGMEPTLAELQEHARAHVAGYKIPRDLVVVDAIVRSPSGKPDYRWARAAAGDGNSA